MKYRVHCYVTVRVPVQVEAENHRDAIEKATADTDFGALFNHGEHEFADEISGYLVDEEGDEEYARTQWYDAEL